MRHRANRWVFQAVNLTLDVGFVVRNALRAQRLLNPTNNLRLGQACIGGEPCLSVRYRILGVSLDAGGLSAISACESPDDVHNVARVRAARPLLH